MSELKDKYIFIIEDDVTNMSVYAVTFKRIGALVIQDYWNINTLKLLHSQPRIDAILLDLNLHYGINGYEIYDQIKAVPALADIPVIAVSAADPTTHISKTKEKGFAGFIGKPINPFKLPEQVAACLRGEAVWYIPGEQLGDY